VSPARQPQPPHSYRISVQGHLADRWAARFEGMTLTRRPDGTTLLEGPVADQSALHGLLRTVSDLALPLLSVTPTPDLPTSSVVDDLRRSTP